jgi:uncharacterized membrane protein
MYGFVSLLDIENLLAEKSGKKTSAVICTLLLFLGSFGIYLGRFLRWNSWDIIQAPFRLFGDIGDRFINPLSHPRTWGLTILMGILLNFMYWSMKLMGKQVHKSTEIEESLSKKINTMEFVTLKKPTEKIKQKT